MDDAQEKQPEAKTHCHYFVDEAGDGTLFNGKGKVLIGEDGCSRYFMLGILEVPDPQALGDALETLRRDLLNDPYFRKIPSMQASENKTALAFHAKDDLPEIRREVFKLLRQFQDLKFYAAVRDKQAVLSEVRQYTDKRYHPNDLYDQLVSQLFMHRLHKQNEYSITFATRGTTDRTRALKTALNDASQRFEYRWGIKSQAQINISAVSSTQKPCLQAADYILWAIQRCYEKREDRYLDYVWPVCHLVHDIDDKRKMGYGVYYVKKNPLTLDKLPSL
jgi:hypothetical protein